jgi:hypothetical protein
LLLVPSLNAKGEEQKSPSDNLSEIGAKLSNPLSDVWALFTQFGLTFNDGELNQKRPKVAGNIMFEPVVPLPLYGTGDDEWKLVIRPTVPFFIEQPVFMGVNSYERKTSLGDTLLPFVVGPPTGNLIIGIGPTFTLPTATTRRLGSKQWQIGPAGVLGYKNKKLIFGVFPQYFWKMAPAGQGDIPNASNLSMLYFFAYNLPDAWQVMFNPTINYNHKASSGNQWNVPVGLGVSKTIRIGRTPIKFQLAGEYSVVNQDAFGQRFQFKLNVIPVIPSLVKHPVFGGK